MADEKKKEEVKAKVVVTKIDDINSPQAVKARQEAAAQRRPPIAEQD